ncbi:IclR family transcriptional regulator [Salibacterium aidingense]|uniref:IclR family transcriptional regulator n=1 Tax=Salibacterium aidingense TaxID=384933 RepID=UPI003BC34670
MSTKKEYTVPALEKAIMIMNTLSYTKKMTVSEIHKQLDIPKTTVFVILNTLEKNKFIEKTSDGKFSLGHGIFHLGMSYYRNADIRNVAKPYMEKLIRNTSFSCHLAVLVENQPVYIEKVKSESFVQFATQIGDALPLHLSGVGKALASGMTNDQIKGAVENNLEVLTPKSYTTVKEVLEDIELVRKTGYAIEDEQMEEGIRCIGAPIYDNTQDVVAAISITSLVKDLPTVKIPIIGEEVANTARNISLELGYDSTTNK